MNVSCQDALLLRDILESRTKGKLTRNRKRLHIINDNVVKKHIRNSQKRGWRNINLGFLIDKEVRKYLTGV